jgi:chromate transporter
VNAAVVGLLLAALYQPVFTSAVIMPLDMALVIIGFSLLKVFKPSLVWLVIGFAAMGSGLSML